MTDTGIIREIDELGRIVVPKSLRKKMNINCALTDLVLGKLGNESGINTVVSERYRYVSLSAAVNYSELICLGKAKIALGSKAKHNFTKSYNLHF